MSEFINNQSQQKERLKAIIKSLHDGADPEVVKHTFKAEFGNISALEITELEQDLMAEGMSATEIQKLCDVHAFIFKDSISPVSISLMPPTDEHQWHPAKLIKLENASITQFIDQQLTPIMAEFLELQNDQTKAGLLNALDILTALDRHYSKKENLIFPYMENHGITAPPQVMWGVDDDIRALLKALKVELQANVIDAAGIKAAFDHLVAQVNEMIFKEEEIMIPMILEKFTTEEWQTIEEGMHEIGFPLIAQVQRWKPSPSTASAPGPSACAVSPEKTVEGEIPFDAGSLTAEEVNAILNTVPVDMTFVDANDRVKYFTQGKERIFDRPKAIIGREVKHCHPPKSVHIVEQIVADLRSGKKDHEDFWIRMGEQFVYIRYFAVRNEKGDFLGTLEVTQNIKPIIELEGEKRLMSPAGSQ